MVSRWWNASVKQTAILQSVFASALTSPKDVREGYKIGVNNYIKKPFVPDELDAHIHGLLKMKEGTKTRNESGFYKIGRYTLDAEHASLRNDETNEKKNTDRTRSTNPATAGRKQKRNNKTGSNPQPFLEYGRRLFCITHIRCFIAKT